MAKFIEFTCVDDTKLRIDKNSIVAYKECTSEQVKDGDRTITLPPHTVIWYGGGTIRVIDSYDEVTGAIELSEMF